MRNIRKYSLFFIILGLLFLGAAVGLCTYNEFDSQRAADEKDKILRKLHDVQTGNVSESTESNNMESSNIPNLTKNNDISKPSINKGFFTSIKSSSMPYVIIDGNKYLGVLEIPSLGLKLPVMEEWNYEKLRVSPCRYSGSYLTNDLVICAHNYDSHFGQIVNVDIGEDVYFTSIDNMTIHYIISNRETVIPTAVEQMIVSGEDWDLTLFTCFWDGRTRCAVRCVCVLED